MTKEIENMGKMFVTFGGEVEGGNVDDLLNNIEETYTEDENLLKKNLGNEDTVRLIYGIKGFPTYLHEILNNSDKPEKVTKLNGPKDLVNWLHKEFKLNTIVSKIYAQVVLGILTTMNMSAEDLEDMKGSIAHPGEISIDTDSNKSETIIDTDFVEDSKDNMNDDSNIDELLNEEDMKEPESTTETIIETKKDEIKPIQNEANTEVKEVKTNTKIVKKDGVVVTDEKKEKEVSELIADGEMDMSCIANIKMKYSQNICIDVMDKVISKKYMSAARMRNNEMDKIVYIICNLKEITKAIHDSKKLDEMNKLTLSTSIEDAIKKFTDMTMDDVINLIEKHKGSFKPSESKLNMIDAVNDILKLA